MVPMGNPDHMVAATAKFWKEYPVEGDKLESGKWESVHAGFDPVYANNDPNRVAPYDMLKMLEKEGIIGSVYPALISTTGNSTSVADSTRMGQEIAERLVSAGAGIPATHICTVTPISKTVGAARIFGAQAIPYPTGDPNLPPEKEMNRRREIVMGALNLLTEGGGSVSGESNAVFTD